MGFIPSRSVRPVIPGAIQATRVTDHEASPNFQYDG